VRGHRPARRGVVDGDRRNAHRASWGPPTIGSLASTCIPWSGPLIGLFMLSVNARKRGSVVLPHPFVHFGKLSETLRKTVRGQRLRGLRHRPTPGPGTPAREVFQKGVEAYRRRAIRKGGGSSTPTGGRSGTSRGLPDTLPHAGRRRDESAVLLEPFHNRYEVRGTILAMVEGPELITRPGLFSPP